MSNSKNFYRVMGFDIEIIEATDNAQKFTAYTDEALCDYMLKHPSASAAHAEFNKRGYHNLTCERMATIYTDLIEGTARNYNPALRTTIKRLIALGSRLITPRIMRNAERQYWAKQNRRTA